MRIRHVVCVALPKLGGMGTAALRWCEGLAERGHTVDLVVPKTKGFAPTHPLIRPWPVWIAWGNGAVLRHQRDLWCDIDLLHLHIPFYGVEEFLLWKKTPKPVVATFHMDAVHGGILGAAIKLHQNIIQPYLLKKITRILPSSLDYVRSSSAASDLKCRPERWQELPLFVDEAIFCPSQTASSARERALFVSALDRAHLFKGLSLIFAALQALPELQLTVIGDGDARADFEREAVSRGVASRIIFRGRVSQEELIVAYREAKVLLSPSTSAAEAFGLAALEAQACGTPVIAADLPGVRTVVRDGQTGFLVQPGSVSDLVRALRRFTEDSTLADRLGRQARVWVQERFSRARCLDRLEQVYQEVCILPS